MYWKYYILDESLFLLPRHQDRVEQDLQKGKSIHCSPCWDICLHFHQSWWDITQKGCAYLCAVAQHTVRFLKPWTFGTEGARVGNSFGPLPGSACHSRLPTPNHKQQLHKHLSMPSTLLIGKPHHPALPWPWSLGVLYTGRLFWETGKETKKKKPRVDKENLWMSSTWIFVKPLTRSPTTSFSLNWRAMDLMGGPFGR